MKRRLLIATLCWLTLFQARAVSIMDDLSGQGFEDVRVAIVDSVVYASVEPTAWRGTFRGAAVALLALFNHYPQVDSFELVITEYQLPQVAVHARRTGGDWPGTSERPSTV